MDAPILARQELAACETVPGCCRSDLELLVSEVVTNAVRHARCLGEDRIEVDAFCSPQEVRVVVRDGGTAVPARRRAGANGGYGLHIVDTLAHEWGAGPGELWFVLRPPGSEL